MPFETPPYVRFACDLLDWGFAKSSEEYTELCVLHKYFKIFVCHQVPFLMFLDIKHDLSRLLLACLNTY